MNSLTLKEETSWPPAPDRPRGVIVRPIAAYGMPDYLRVSIGLASENKRFLEALEESLMP